jgi:hypothetical protein
MDDLLHPRTNRFRLALALNTPSNLLTVNIQADEFALLDTLDYAKASAQPGLECRGEAPHPLTADGTALTTL